MAAFLDGAVTTGETPKLVNPFQPSTSEAILFDEYLDQAPSADDRGLLLDYFLQENLYVQVLGTAPELNPLNYITKDYPPTVIIHGTNDRYVPIDTSRLLVSRLTAVGVKVKFIQVLGADHSFEHFARATDSKTSKLWSTYLAPIFSYLDLFVFSD